MNKFIEKKNPELQHLLVKHSIFAIYHEKKMKTSEIQLLIEVLFIFLNLILNLLVAVV